MDPQQPQMPPQQNPMGAAPKKSIGPIIGIIVIIILLVLGALYVWGGKLSKSDAVPDARVQNMETAPELSNSDEVDAIESDLMNTDLNIDIDGI